MLKAQFKKILEGYGYELKQVKRARTLVGWLESRDIDVVLDVGANIGQFGEQLRSSGYRGRIVSFEPIAAVYAQLKDKADGDTLWEARHYALGEAEGTGEIHVSKSSDLSSLRAPTSKLLDMFPRAAEASLEIISIKSLDSIYSEFLGKNVFLKIDTQGYEKQVLDGSAEALKHLKGAQLEVPIEELYEGVWDASAAFAYMMSAGFVPSQVSATSWRRSDPASFTEMDVIFRRKEG
jgi:FkbM family methyltransferase